MENELGWVYLVRAGDTDLYKIGRTSQKPKKRLRSLQTASPHELHLQYAVRSERYRQLEESLHDQYSESREQSEWFRFSEATVQDVQGAMTRWVRGENITDAADPLTKLSGDFLTTTEEILTTALAHIAFSLTSSLRYEPREEAAKVLKRLNEVGLLTKHLRDQIEQRMDVDNAQEILRASRTTNDSGRVGLSSGWVGLIRVKGTDFYRFRTTKREQEALLDGPAPEFLGVDPTNQFSMIEVYEVEDIERVKRQLEERFSYKREEGRWLLLDEEGDLKMVREEMRLSVRENQFRSLSMKDISGSHATDAEKIMFDALSEIITYMARSSISATRVLNALQEKGILPPHYEERIADELNDSETLAILGEDWIDTNKGEKNNKSDEGFPPDEDLPF